MSPDYYQALQVDPAADAEVLEAAYRRLARKFHPDVNSAPEAEPRMRELNEAWSVLRDPGRRAAYDQLRARAVAATAPPPPAYHRTATPPRPEPASRSTIRPIRPEPGRAARSGRAPTSSAAPRPDRPAAHPRRNGWRRLVDRLLTYRLVVLGATSAVVLTVVVGAAAAGLFVPTEPAAETATTPPGVVLVTRIAAPEPTATARPTPNPTATGWPPFIYVPVPVQATPDPPATQSAAQPTVDPSSGFFGRTAGAIRRRLLGPSPPQPPEPPVPPG